MKIAAWNINGIRARLDTATAWVKDANPDILCFQEIKSEDAAFPAEVFEELGYNVAVHGQKGFNGVAILSKLPLEEPSRGLPGDDSDTHSRFIEAVVSVPGGALRVASLYLPNGNPAGSDKFTYKLAWMERLEAYARARLADEEAFVLAGDFNVIPEPVDARFPDNWRDDALFQPETRAAFRRLVNLGLTDAFRACEAGPGHYTFWDYQAGAWQKNNGIRIDHLLLSPQATDRLTDATIDKRPRGWEKPSDHVPVVIDLDFQG
ncbi:MAG: exodeoxyribonuclease III [Bauldia sp.]|nr:exodeoxyribonuclease III [Bauldia sp.]